jgi:TRAP-type C4-dicarboxylate transport system substrate-binding protein
MAPSITDGSPDDTATGTPHARTVYHQWRIDPMGGMRRSAVCLLLLGTVAACTVGEAPGMNREGGKAVLPVRLTMVDANNSSQELDRFVQAVRTQSAGAIEITVTHGWRQGEPNYEVDLVKDVVAGKADLGVAAARAFDVIEIRSLQALVAPFLIDSHDLQRRVLSSETATSMLSGLRAGGLEGIGYLVGPLRRPIGFTRSLASLSDFDGARIGIRPSRVAEMTFAALGASSAVLPPGDDTGFDGIEGDLLLAREFFDRGVDSMTGNVVLWPRMDVLFANAGRFDGLSAQQQTVLTEAARTALGESDRSIQAMEAERLGILCALGLNVEQATGAHLSELVGAVAPVYAELEREAQTKAAIAAIRDMRGETASPEVVASCPAVESPDTSARPTAIDGRWTTSHTLEELASSPLLMDAGEINDQNWGEFQMILADGQITFSQSNDLDRYTTSGAFTVDGGDVTFRFVEGTLAGESFKFRWSLFQRTLTLERHPTMPISPTPFVLKPWTISG